MPRYIDAEPFGCISWKGIPEGYDDTFDSGVLYVADLIDDAPTVSPDEVRGVGKWGRVETEFGLRCPKCGKLLDEYVNGGECVALSEIPNYCPNCGAKMEVSE